MTDITLNRSTGDDAVCHDGIAPGMRGTVSCGDASWHSIERGEGYKWLKPGVYECEFQYWTNKAGNKYRAIRINGIYSNRVYIHSANRPSELAGCIAIGKIISSNGVLNSKNAILELFEQLGGFEFQKRFKLSVTGTMIAGQGTCEPGDSSNIQLNLPDKSNFYAV